MPMNPRLLRPRATGFDPKSLAGLVAWFDADDVSTFTLTGASSNEVSQWRDKSGRGYAVSQGTANNRPRRTGTLRGRACVDFDGANDFLATTGAGLATYLAGDKEWSAYIVGEMPTFAEVSAGIEVGTWLNLNSSASASTYLRSTPDGGTVQFVNTNDAGTNTGTVFTSNAGPAGAQSASQTQDFFICSMDTGGGAVTRWRTHTVMACAGNRSPFLGPYNGASVSGGTRTGNFNYSRFTIGCFNPSYQGDFFAGRIAEVILYERRLSDSERSRLVGGFLSPKYNKVSVPVL